MNSVDPKLTREEIEAWRPYLPREAREIIANLHKRIEELEQGLAEAHGWSDTAQVARLVLIKENDILRGLLSSGAEADARRYRWLRDGPPDASPWVTATFVVGKKAPVIEGDALDAAIDEAMEPR